MEHINHTANNPENASASIEHASTILQAKLDKTWIKTRKQGGANLSYIGGHIVIQLLNKAFNYNWNFEIVDKQIVQSLGKIVKDNGRPRKDNDGNFVYTSEPPYVEVRARLTVPGYGFKEQYGSKTIIGGATEQESATKAATTDALKKCASLYGIGLELYSDEKEKDVMEQTEPAQLAVDHTVEEETEGPKKVEEPAAEKKAEAPAEEQPAKNDAGESNGSSNGKPAETKAPSGSTGKTTSSKETAKKYNSKDVEDLQDLKAQMNIDNNKQLNPFVQEFFDDGEATVKSISPDVIATFNEFLRSRMQDEQQEEAM